MPFYELRILLVRNDCKSLTARYVKTLNKELDIRSIVLNDSGILTAAGSC